MSAQGSVGECRNRPCNRSLLLGEEAAALRCALTGCTAAVPRKVATVLQVGLEPCPLPPTPGPFAPVIFRLPKAVTLRALARVLPNIAAEKTAAGHLARRTSELLQRPTGLPNLLLTRGLELLRRDELSAIVAEHGESVLPHIRDGQVCLDLGSLAWEQIAERLATRMGSFLPAGLRRVESELQPAFPGYLHIRCTGNHVVLNHAWASSVRPDPAATEVVVMRASYSRYRVFITPPQTSAAIGEARAATIAHGLLRFLGTPAAFTDLTPLHP